MNYDDNNTKAHVFAAAIIVWLTTLVVGSVVVILVSTLALILSICWLVIDAGR